MSVANRTFLMMACLLAGLGHALAQTTGGGHGPGSPDGGPPSASADGGGTTGGGSGPGGNEIVRPDGGRLIETPIHQVNLAPMPANAATVATPLRNSSERGLSSGAGGMNAMKPMGK